MPRFEQIELLTRRVELPFPPLHQQHLLLICEVLSIAWGDLLRAHRSILLAGAEPEVNALMETRLTQLLDILPMWGQLVRCVARGRESLSFDGTHLEKRPDLNLYLTNRSTLFPLIVECKLINSAQQQSEHRYCVDGLAKFVSGEYAWAAREAVMLAYVRDGSSIAGRLVPYLITSELRQSSTYLVEQMPVRVHVVLDLACSVHRRAFKYPTRSPPNDDPGTIAVWHLWMMP
jgi:hypothetical protein